MPRWVRARVPLSFLNTCATLSLLIGADTVISDRHLQKVRQSSVDKSRIPLDQLLQIVVIREADSSVYFLQLLGIEVK